MADSPKEFTVGRLYMVDRKKAVCYGRGKPSQRAEMVHDSVIPTLKIVEVPSPVFHFVFTHSLEPLASVMADIIDEIPEDEEQDPILIGATVSAFKQKEERQNRIARLIEIKQQRQYSLNQAANQQGIINELLAGVVKMDKQIEELTALLQQ